MSSLLKTIEINGSVYGVINQDQTPEICLEALRQHIWALEHVRDPLHQKACIEFLEGKR